MDGRYGYHRVTFSYHPRLGNRGTWSLRSRSTRSDTWQIYGNLQINSPTYVVSLYFTNCCPSYFTVIGKYGSLWCHLSRIHNNGYWRIFDQTSQPCLLGLRIHPICGHYIHVYCRNEFRLTLCHVARQIPQIVSWWRVQIISLHHVRSQCNHRNRSIPKRLCKLRIKHPRIYISSSYHSDNNGIRYRRLSIMATSHGCHHLCTLIHRGLCWFNFGWLKMYPAQSIIQKLVYRNETDHSS